MRLLVALLLSCTTLYSLLLSESASSQQFQNLWCSREIGKSEGPNSLAEIAVLAHVEPREHQPHDSNVERATGPRPHFEPTRSSVLPRQLSAQNGEELEDDCILGTAPQFHADLSPPERPSPSIAAIEGSY